MTEEGVTGYTNDDVIEAIGLSLQDFVDGVCNLPYLSAVRKLKYILDSKTTAVGKKNKSNKFRDKKVTRKEKLPNWFKENEKRDVQDEPSLSTPTDPEQKKQEIERMLQQLRD
ncbi:hypothetical protein JMM81_10750 [Bacillus sp. V3B]|uniref:hypothetical protein n=1 Tax=Bacillus sp. V3B TaxID=2804915 RepID=UPI00210EE0BF|nr:hypothetical protein [Bacillus sp. V3B]MCQ6275438.1 hypothetical protein [Bacillus sp. V3B]